LDQLIERLVERVGIGVEVFTFAQKAARHGVRTHIFNVDRTPVNGRRHHRIADAAVVAADVARALAEDLGSGDVTAALLPDQADSAYLLCKEDGVIAGRPWFDATHRALDPDVRIEWQVSDGDAVTAGTVLMLV